MIGLNHAVTGAFLAAAVKEPVVALPLALMSHFALDALPHWDYKVPGGNRKRQLVMAGDLMLAFLVLSTLSFLLVEQWWVMLLAGMLAIAPDAMWLPEILNNRPLKMKGSDLLSKARRLHSRVQWSETARGLYFEIFWLLIMLMLTFGALS